MDRNDVGGRLRLYRQLRNLTQESLSEVIGVTKQHLGQIERGQCNPSLDFLSKAASALDTHIASFFLGNGNGNDPVMINAHSFPENDGGVRPFSTCGLWMLSGPGGKNIWSKSLCRMLGHASVRVPSLTQFCKHLTTDEAAAFRAFFTQVLEGDVPDSMIFAVTRKDGVQRRVQAVAEILNGGDDLAETAYIIFWDMTDWLETRRIFHYTQQELNDTIRDRTAALTSAVSNAKRELELRQDAERAVNEAHAAFGGFAIKDMAYRDIYEIYPTDVADICRQGNEQVFFSGRPVRTEEWLPNSSGDRRLVSILKSPKLRSDGTVEYVVCSAEDITERWRSEEALKKAKELAEEASRVKSGFLASMSHEIRTPINGIMGMLQLLQTTELSEDQDSFVDLAVRSCDRLVRLLSDIMDFSRIEAGKLAIQASPMSLESVFDQVRELFAPFLEDSKVTLEFTLDPALPCRIIGDAFRLQQILNNFVDNACKFTSSGSVSVQAFRLPAVVPETVRIFFEVSDTGIGIPDDELKSLFDPFIQISDGYVRSRKGVGLGLSICKRLVELMGGSMSVISEAGKGTTFAFSLSFAMDSTLDHLGAADGLEATNL
ncbi:PAS domain S-box-containing protein [Desulfomicrobium norvegicum]|uniref:histidine kinase n=1 Tax=Desulfomicrobium norvegicum (strain DSM 1741 / NCIMB 8310) TaxID=52561 RepID=A0A8G2C2X1_DESNO|nr:ATP-binding protein [Desulfomicrobium norvegicum]SFL72768.1 PAS domain S-box-containing protein [Desulfomicrobium norvegicum]